MQIIRKLFIGTMTALGVAACITAAVLAINNSRSQPLLEMDECRTTAWENLGATFDIDVPTEPDQLPGLARVVDPKIADDADVREVIDEELRDASPEEREIWRTELSQHSPEEIREILGLRRRLCPTLGHARVGDVEFVAADQSEPKPLSEAALASASRISSDPQVSSDAPVATDALGLIESAIEATHSAEQVILNNIANANTVGFKRSRAVFGDLPYRQVVLPGQADAQGRTAATDIALGAGVKLLATQIDVSQGRLRHTQRPLDLAIQGEGYFQINDGHRFFYTRTGSFALNAKGEIALISKDCSRLLEPTMRVPPDATKILISSTGSVSVLQPGKSEYCQIGQLELSRFLNPEALAPRGENLFEQTEASGIPLITTPGHIGLGELRQGDLEESNVVVADELAELRRMQEHVKTLRQLRADFAGTNPAP